MSRTYRRDPNQLHLGKKFRDGRPHISSTPRWWITEYMNRPKRHENIRLCDLVKKGYDSDNIAWPEGNHKPHIYYW